MARPNLRLIEALRTAARNIESGAPYQWGHMGSCNCGHLAQVITSESGATIHAGAQRGHGDWSEQVIDYCPTSGLPMDDIIGSMLEAGLTRDDLVHLERLSDPKILRRLPPAERDQLRRNRRDDVVRYLLTWAGMLEEELPAKLTPDDVAAEKPTAMEFEIESETETETMTRKSKTRPLEYALR